MVGGKSRASDDEDLPSKGASGAGTTVRRGLLAESARPRGGQAPRAGLKRPYREKEGGEGRDAESEPRLALLMLVVVMVMVVVLVWCWCPGLWC